MTKQQKKLVTASPWTKRLCEGGFILVSTLALFVLFALVTYHTSDPGWFHLTKSHAMVSNAGGKVGAYTADFLYSIFGYASYGMPLMLAYLAWLILHDHCTLGLLSKPMLALRTSGIVLLLIGSCGLLVFFVAGKTALLYKPGGLFGQEVARFSHAVLNSEGAILFLLATVLIGMTWLTGLSWVHLTETIGRYVLKACGIGLNGVRAILEICMEAGQAIYQSGCRLFALFIVMKKNRAAARLAPQPVSIIPAAQPKILAKKEKKFAIKSLREREPAPVAVPTPPVASPVFSATNKPLVEGVLPPLDLLVKATESQGEGVGYSHQALEELSQNLEQHLLDFGIQANVVAAHPGPVITRFELQLAAGVKVSKLSALSKDLARSLSVTSVRVVEIIPGKTVVGLELPNPKRTMVVLSEVLSSEVYQQAHSPLTLALGVDIAGHPMVVDLAKMPHLLVAGTTGSGKSVGINAMILSLLFKSTPEQIRLILIDPKMLELSVYDGIPHLLTPVVTDMKEAASALRWCVEEMERRYRLMAAMGVRNLAGFNKKITDAIEQGQPLTDPLWKPTDSMDEKAPELAALPYVVVVIDELADMMMVVGKKVEQLIARIAQKARAAGIHLILATQRPSVDVLTGLIKSNIPTRISFQVSSKIDSRTILDQQGADQLLGHGDMLFLAPGTGAPLRVHGAFVDDQEVHRVADDWRARGEPTYIDAITDDLSELQEPGGAAVEEADALYDEAVAFVMQTRKASTSSVQRRFKIGYNRAARLIDEMERVGMVGPLEGGVRDVLVASRTEE
ncbi:MAG: DNA translocase FtsK 4TM domain-containing protein [Gammaproteobacteria bacterium]|nr:DNA translocase FtsK 4TM domain-containing protein [Gammaproteobacteria bacterium]MCH9763462.1 DNA translocase FtsK 4TM domain-containing protein [Gammaproteobacteria bacterium]